MPLPEGFSDWEHLQTVILQSYNRIVREEFSDLGDDSWDDDITVPRGSLRVACTVKDADSAPMVAIRMLLFYFTLRKASDLQVPVYGIPVNSYQESWRFKPQIQLYFQEDQADVDEGFAPVTGEIGFRLANETNESLTMAETHALANKVKTAFSSGNGFVWRKGRIMCTYTDRDRGYKLQILARDKTEGKRVIEQILDIQSHTPDWEFMNVIENEEPAEKFPIIPPTRSILGKSRRLPRKRPIADVRFRHALLHVWGLPNPIVLVDRLGIYRDALVDSA